MNKNWTQFLLSQGAQIEDGRVMYFGDAPGNALSEKRAAMSSTQSSTHILCDLSHYGLISATGADAESFLQNQFCNDVHNISALQSQLNAYCNPKGRILAFFRLFQLNEHYYLRLPQEILEPTINRLRMFVMMSKVSLEDASDKLMRIGFSGPEAEQRLNELVGQTPTRVPTTVNASSQTSGLTIIRIPGPQPRFEIYGDETAVKRVWEQLSTDAKPVGSGCWELLDIHAAIPEIFPDTQEAFVPQMVNLQAINALSFKKGCYPGQEIVARMHYLGKLKRCMYVAHTEDDTAPAPGDALFAEGSESGQGVGKVVRAQASPGGGADLLAVIEISSAEQRALRLKDANGPLLKLRKLPYMVETPS